MASFEYIWNTVRDRHYDRDFGGLDWQAVREELRPRVEQAGTMTEARSIIRDLISRLQLSHFDIIPANVYQQMDQFDGVSVGGGVTGIDVRIIKGHLLVTRVESDSPAARAGVKTGWEIINIHGNDIVSKHRSIGRELEGKTYKEFIITYDLKLGLQGKIGGTIAVEFLNGMDQTVQCDIPLVEKKGGKYRFGHLPAVYAWIDVNTIEDNIGYIAFNGFFDPVNVMTVYNNAVKSFMTAKGIIIDIRGNPGGIIGMAIGMSGWFVPEKNQHLGTMYLRNNTLKFIVNPRYPTYTGPVAILVDGLSLSCSEMFAGGLQDLGRARIFGSRTGGAALPSIIEKLPNGDGFQFAFAGYRSKNGKVLEGIGVTPDVEVSPTREALLQGRDLALEAAVAWIRGKKR